MNFNKNLNAIKRGKITFGRDWRDDFNLFLCPQRVLRHCLKRISPLLFPSTRWRFYYLPFLGEFTFESISIFKQVLCLSVSHTYKLIFGILIYITHHQNDLTGSAVFLPSLISIKYLFSVTNHFRASPSSSPSLMTSDSDLLPGLQ